MKNPILLFFFLLASNVYAQKSENEDSIKHKNNGVFISVDGFMGKSSSNFEPGWQGSFSFQSGILVGYSMEYLKFGIGVYNENYSRFQEYTTTDFLGNVTYDDGLIVSSNFIVPNFQIGTNFNFKKKLYPLLLFNYQLPIIISKKWKTTKDTGIFPYSQNRSDFTNDSLSIPVNQNIKLNAGLGYRINNVISLEASFAYCHHFKGLDFKNTSNTKSPYILGGQFSAIFNFKNHKN